MRNHALKTMTMISVLIFLSAVSARAQAGTNFMVTVPFEFTVSGKTFLAGEYLVLRSTQASAEGLMIRSRDNEEGAYFLTKPIQTAGIQNQTTVVFKRYGDQYFLSQIWISGRSTGREVFKSKEEQTVERELARRAAKPETITILGQARLR